MKIVMIGDKIILADEVNPAYLDRGTFFGDGVYEVVRSFGGRLFALDEHLGRFAQSLAGIEIKGIDLNRVRSKILKAFDTAQISDAIVYFHITRGSEPRNRIFNAEIKPNFFLSISEMNDLTEMKAQGIAVTTFPDWRWKRCDIKSLNLLPNVLASQDAARKGADEAIFVNDTNLITEGASSAFFAIRGRTLQTSPLDTNILPSITRKYTLQAAELSGLSILEESLTPDLAVSSDELCIASTTRDILSVVKFNQIDIGDGKPGPYTKKMTEAFYSIVRSQSGQSV